ncbi:MAG: HAMP domain-containing histidine kinase [Sphingobium sp.]|jgi:signal transduction histidine kinase|nr:HAMP domain-containing histidine kinase [Sphingobium sp.]MCI1271941.1 HAMP domain-containing histidine kinase [Sphingobium sp.]MCI2051617.1 HAMP domain-containing histidine kinase [Sphingobium sp.]
MMSETRSGGAMLLRLDAADHIQSGDDAILHLHEAAGGAPMGRIAVPQIASVARLARRLQILISRPLLIGGDTQDIRMWVRAKPVDDGVEMIFSEWQEIPHPPGNETAALRAAESALAPEGAEWRTGADMRFIHLGAELDFAASGDAFSEIFPDAAAGVTPLAAAIAARRPFFALTARAGAAQRLVQLSGHPLFDADGSFLGYRGKASLAAEPDTADAAPEAPPSAPPPAEPVLPDFGKRLDLALRQPLTRIIANAETIRSRVEGPIRGDYAAYAADIANAGRHLMELVDDLADLQAIDRPNFTVAREEIDLADIARRAAGLLGVKAADRGLRIEAPKMDETAPAIGEFRRALQIAVNLLGNAVRYSPENSTIWLRAEAEGDAAMLVVADQGRGIALEDQQRVFEKFERLGRDDAAGTGLGLYISRRLARAMQGDILIDSAPGQGARFSLVLPASTPA